MYPNPFIGAFVRFLDHDKFGEDIESRVFEGLSEQIKLITALKLTNLLYRNYIIFFCENELFDLR